LRSEISLRRGIAAIGATSPSSFIPVIPVVTILIRPVITVLIWPVVTFLVFPVPRSIAFTLVPRFLLSFLAVPFKGAQTDLTNHINKLRLDFFFYG
jgi:hypothetical protein